MISYTGLDKYFYIDNEFAYLQFIKSSRRENSGAYYCEEYRLFIGEKDGLIIYNIGTQTWRGGDDVFSFGMVKNISPYLTKARHEIAVGEYVIRITTIWLNVYKIYMLRGYLVDDVMHNIVQMVILIHPRTYFS